jgi:hypothetical protein
MTYQTPQPNAETLEQAEQLYKSGKITLKEYLEIVKNAFDNANTNY